MKISIILISNSAQCNATLSNSDACHLIDYDFKLRAIQDRYIFHVGISIIPSICLGVEMQ